MHKEGMLMADIKTNRENEWEEIEKLVAIYQKRFTESDAKIFFEADVAITSLIHKFNPLFNKYLKIIKKCEINFYDSDARAFVFCFIDKNTRKDFPSNIKDVIHKFQFIVKTYGALSEEEIMSDMQEIFIKLLKRYKQIGKSFCGYLHNIFYHEMSRLIKAYISNPVNIPYNIIDYQEYQQTNIVSLDSIIDDLYERHEILDLNWINGKECGYFCSNLTALERKILLEYYLNNHGDKYIGELFSMHMSTINYMRHAAIKKVAASLNNVDLKTIRHRKINSDI